MSNKTTTPERLAAFSDGVFSVIITSGFIDGDFTPRYY